MTRAPFLKNVDNYYYIDRSLTLELYSSYWRYLGWGEGIDEEGERERMGEKA